MKALNELKTDDYGKFYPQCDKTMIGVIQNKESPGTMTEHRAECFYGVKEEADT